jgi:hypothetical protein
VRPHEKLDAWKKAIDFVLSIYEATQSLPKDEKFGLTAQIRRRRFQYQQISQRELHANQQKSS